ncbi:MAG: YehR family protein [Bacilli bacterium]|jgi:uncharacterized lipoprotein YehR (DUF1307 family)|nr:YehR family protein [Bacilli bacterium]
MKKIMMLIVVSLFCLTGCGNETKTMTCTRSMNQNGLGMDLRYEVEYSKNTVTKVKSIEKVTSSSKDVLENYKEAVEAIYEPYKDVEHYNYELKIDGDTLTSTLEVDYSKVDTKKMIEIDSANAQLIKDGKIKIDDIKAMYESSSVGATCTK